MVAVAGLVVVAAGIVITLGINHVTSGESVSVGTAWLLALAFVAESVGYIVEERQELLLMVAVRQLTYRRFRSVFARSRPSLEVRGHVLTYPAQISQFAFIVDGAVSTVQIIAFLVMSLTLYGVGGAIAVLLIVGLALVGIRLITLIGRLWKQYVNLEGERRRWIQRVADALPRGRLIPSWDSALDTITHIRNKEEHVLRRRVLLQVINGFVDRSALTITLAIVAILAWTIWPDTRFGLGIILAARYLYGAVQSNLTNYRIIRLAVPMMRELDSLEAAPKRENGTSDPANRPTQPVEVLLADSDRATLLRTSAVPPECAFVPHNPQLSQSVLSAWRASATTDDLSRFTNLAAAMALPGEVVERLWQDANTLSSGERHRAAVALVMTEAPEWLILDETFSAPDPATRDLVAKVVLSHVPACTIITSSEEYIPAYLAGEGTAGSPRHGQQAPAPRGNHSESANAAPPPTLPDPERKRATFRRSVELLFGPHIVVISLGALLLAGSEVLFALSVAGNDRLSFRTACAAGVCAAASLLGSLMFFFPVYRVPIARLSELHSGLIHRIDRFARPQTSGAVVGRLGEDFSELQMSVPQALGAVLIVVVQTLMLIAGAVAGAPPLIIVVAAVMPLSALAMRQGAKRMMPAATIAANRRGDFLGAVGTQAGLHSAPVSNGLRHAGELAYNNCEGSYWAASVNQANAYTYRTVLIQSLTLALNVFAVFFATTSSGPHSLIAPAAVIFFSLTLASGIQSTVETLQRVGVLGLTAERVRLLENFHVNSTYPPVRHHDLDRVYKAIRAGDTLVALIGSTGAGKSVLLDALCRRLPDSEVALIPDVDPFAPDDANASGLNLARTETLSGAAQLLLLDETFKNLTARQERAELESLAKQLKNNGKQSVVVLHSRSNLDCFDTVVNI
ncbi:hypothetical protein [Nanchangia anserum]|uniref:hypothetical protein n=1 Tax=Nanchangia anserum TaxID=2692125 RepID=UPI0030B8627F